MKNSSFIRFVYIIVLYTITIRFAYIHFHGGDGWISFNKSGIVMNYGFIAWYNGPASYFGWIPNSYPVGNHLIISAVTLVTDLDLWFTFWLCDILLSCFAVFSFILLCRSLELDKKTVLYSTFCFSTAMIFLSVTTNNGSSRGIFICMLPLAVYFLINLSEGIRNQIRMAFLFSLFLVVFASTHRTFHFFWIVFLSSYFLVIALNFLMAFERFKNFKARSFANVYFVILFILFLMGANRMIPIVEFGSNSIWGGREAFTNLILPNSNFLFVLLNLAATTFEKSNSLALFIPLGLFHFSSLNISIPKKLLIYVTLFFIPIFSFEVLYFPHFSMILIGLFGGIGLRAFEESREWKIGTYISGGYFGILFLASLVYIEWEVSRGFYFSTLVALFAFSFLFRYLYDLSRKDLRNELLVIASLLLCVSYSLSQTVDLSHLEYSQYESGNGELAYEYRCLNTGYWFRDSGGNVMAESGLQNKAIAISGQKHIGLGFYLTENLVYLDKKNTSFDIGGFIANGRKFVSVEDINDRYEPANIYWKVWAAEHNLAEAYEIEYFATHSDPEKIQYYQDDALKDLSMYYFLQDYSYAVYKSEETSFLFYNNYN